MNGHNFIDGKSYKVVIPFMLCQPDIAVEEEEYTQEEVDELVEKFGTTKDGIRTDSIDLPEGTVFIKLPDTEECKNEESIYWKVLEFQIEGTNVVAKLVLRCPYTDSKLEDILEAV